MVEYYILSLLRNTRRGTEWEEIYLEIDGSKSRVIAHTPQTRATSENKLEKISEEEAKETLSRLNIDWGHG